MPRRQETQGLEQRSFRAKPRLRLLSSNRTQLPSPQKFIATTKIGQLIPVPIGCFLSLPVRQFAGGRIIFETPQAPSNRPILGSVRLGQKRLTAQTLLS